VTGIGAVRAKRITDAWAEQKVVREIMVFLHSNGVGTARAVRIFKTYGADPVQVMTENPYRLARDIRGIGFKSADAIAMKLGIEKTAMIRLRAGISYALTEAMDEGHCGLPTDQLIPLAKELLEAPKELILTALELERSEGAVIADKVGDTACIFLAGLYRAEQAIADRLIRIVTGRLPWPWIDEEKAVPWIEKQRSAACRQSEGCDPAGADGESAGSHRGPRRRQDDDRQFDPQDPCGQRRAIIALRPHGPRRQTHDRSDGRRGQDDPPTPGGRSQERRFQTQCRQPARL
jgi:exodeoxyribonuclease V alpha subunit